MVDIGDIVFPESFLSGIALNVWNEIKHLTYSIANDLSDDKDIHTAPQAICAN